LANKTNIGIIVLNWNNYIDTKKCIDIIISHKKYDLYNIELLKIYDKRDYRFYF